MYIDNDSFSLGGVDININYYRSSFHELYDLFTFYCRDNTLAKSNLGEKDIFHPTSYSHLSMEVMAGAQAVTKTEIKHRGIASPGVFRYFSYTVRPTCLGMVVPTVGWALLHQIAIKKMPHRFPVLQYDRGDSSTEVPFSWTTLVYVKWTKLTSRVSEKKIIIFICHI